MNNRTLKRTTALLLLCCHYLLAVCQAQAFKASLLAKKGLFLQQGALTWGMGSEINFLDADRKHHEYYFTWWEQDVNKIDATTTALSIGSKNTAVDGTLLLQQQRKSAALQLNCNWNKETEGVCDILYLKIWAPFFEQATWTNQQGQVLQELLNSFYDSVLVVMTSFGKYKIHASAPFSIRTAITPHPGETAYATRDQYFFIEQKNIKVKKGDQLNRTFWVEELSDGTPVTAKTEQTITRAMLQYTSAAWTPINGKIELLPQPVTTKKLEGYYSIPFTSSKPTLLPVLTLNELVKQYWKVDGYLLPALDVRKDTSLATEEYRVSIRNRIEIRYASATGLHYALQSLSQLVEQKNGQLILPHTEIQDAPKISWRGIHMFTGPTSWGLHKKMFDQVLLPLKINKAVLQCEQATWKCFPNIHNSISIPLADLKSEFNYLRSKNIEPIPLIQSLGHMEWFFKPQQNRALAINPSYPYTLNTTLPQARQAIRNIWDEAIQLLKPKTIHVGFDEIGMIGFQWPREKEVTLFADQLQWLHRYTQQKNLSLMIWGDMGLAPGEGPDACNGINPERAAQIRKSIPPKTMVADWHYLGNPDPAIYQNSLSIWKKAGLQPIASPWFLSNNIRGFVAAAIAQNVGMLQTTWADFESSEINMLKNIEQFGAYVLALDYAWSGRKELPAQLPYDPVATFVTRFYRQPLPLETKSGWKWTGAIQLANQCDSLTIDKSDRITLTTGSIEKITGWKMLATTALILPEATPVASIELWCNNKRLSETTVLYGREIRAINDARPIYKRVPETGKTEWYHFLSTPVSIDKIVIRTIHPAAGLQLKECVLIQ